MSAARIPVDAGVVIYRHGRTWWIDIHQEGGRRVRRNLRTASRESALRIAREIAAGVVSRLWNVAAAQKLTVASALKNYRESVAWANLADETRKNTLRALGIFSRWLARRRVGAQRCIHDIAVTGRHGFSIEQLAVEIAGPGQTDRNNEWQATAFNINDPDNLGVADITYWVVEGNVGAVEKFTRKGGASIQARRIGSAPAGGKKPGD